MIYKAVYTEPLGLPFAYCETKCPHRHKSGIAAQKCGRKEFRMLARGRHQSAWPTPRLPKDWVEGLS